MNDEENNVTDENIENVEAPKKKAKWLIGLGVFAVVAVVAGTLVFANGGEWFKGMFIEMPNLEYEIQTPNIPNITETSIIPETTTLSSNVYVDVNKTASDNTYDSAIADGSKASPYRSIEAALDTVSSGGSVTIYVAAGTYEEDIVIENKDIDFVGSYNNSFTSVNLNSTPSIIKGSVLIDDSDGSIKTFNFNGTQSSEDSVIDINGIGTNSYQIENNKFENLAKGYVIKVASGEFTQGDVRIANNEFKSVSATLANVISSASSITSTVVENNFMLDCYGKKAIISVGSGDRVVNNIISNSNKKTQTIINAYEAEVYNNTLAYNNNQPTPNITKSAIKSTGNSEIYNNLVVETTTYQPGTWYSSSAEMQAFNVVSSDHLVSNGIYPDVLAADVRGVSGEYLTVCDPEFSKSLLDDGYKLETGSACINNGSTASGVNKDYFGTSRPIGDGYDIGAHEYGTSIATMIPVFVTPLEFATPALTPDGTPENCTDGIDNNSDGLVDCDDPLCTVACSTILEDEICTDGIDNDNDGDTDCDDTDCDSHTSCEADSGDDEDEEDQEICTNGIDDDGDGYVDCIDWDCNDHDFCADDSVTPSDPETCDCNWSDLTDDFDGTAAKGLCEMGCIVGGYPDGTVRLNEKLNRAELLAIAFRASKYENIYDVNMNSDYCFNDVTSEAEGHWFAPYICTAKTKGFVEGYDGNLAKPGNKVILAEALKMMLGALDEDYEINNSGKWYIDMVLEAGEDGHTPYTVNNASDADNVGAVELTRGKAFNMLYRILKY